MKLRDKIYCILNGICTKHLIPKDEVVFSGNFAYSTCPTCYKNRLEENQVKYDERMNRLKSEAQ